MAITQPIGQKSECTHLINLLNLKIRGLIIVILFLACSMRYGHFVFFGGGPTWRVRQSGEGRLSAQTPKSF